MLVRMLKQKIQTSSVFKKHPDIFSPNNQIIIKGYSHWLTQ